MDEVLAGGVIENINQCKCFNIVCDNPNPICDFIINKLNRSATVYKAGGAFTHFEKTVISNSSEIIGKGFLTK